MSLLTVRKPVGSDYCVMLKKQVEEGSAIFNQYEYVFVEERSEGSECFDVLVRSNLSNEDEYVLTFDGVESAIGCANEVVSRMVRDGFTVVKGRK